MDKTTTLVSHARFAFDTTRHQFVVLTPDSRLRVFDSLQGHIKYELAEPDHLTVPLTCLCWGTKKTKEPRKKKRRTIVNQQDNLIAVGTEVGSIVIWDLICGEVLHKLQGNSTKVSAISYNTSCLSLYSAHADGNVQIWNLSGDVNPQHKPTRTISASKEVVSALISTTDDSSFVTAGLSIKVWDLASFKVSLKFSGHPTTVRDLKISGDMLLSASSDRYLSLWNRSPLACRTVPLATFICDSSPVYIDIAPFPNDVEDMYALLAVTDTGVVNIWEWSLSLSQPQRKRKHSSSSSSKGKVVNPSLRISGSSILTAAFVETRPGVILVSYGSEVLPRFHDVPYVDRETGKLIPENELEKLPKVPANSIFLKESSSSSKSSSKHSEAAQILLAAQDSSAPRVTAKTNDDSSKTSIIGSTLSERVAALHQGDTKTTEKDSSKDAETDEATLSADSMRSALLQALHTNNRTLLQSCLSCNDQTVIRNTVKRLPNTSLIPFLHLVVDLLQANPNRSITFVSWIHAILAEHTAYLMTVSEIGSVLGSLYLTVDSRLSVHKKLIKLSGRLDLVLSQISKSTQSAADQKPLSVYTEDQEHLESSEDEDDGDKDGENEEMVSDDDMCEDLDLMSSENEDIMEDEDDDEIL